MLNRFNYNNNLPNEAFSSAMNKDHVSLKERNIN